MFVGEYDKSVVLTYFGAALALTAIYLILQGQVTLAMMAFIGSGVCDLFDGVVARRFKRTAAQERFGIEIDSLCDMISFAALPAVLFLTQLPFGVGNLCFAILYVLAAVTRLAHFNRLAKGEEGGTGYFIGVPVTYGALVFPLTYLLMQWWRPSVLGIVWAILALLMSFLFVWNQRIPKPNRLAYVLFVILALVSLIGLWSLYHG